MLCTFYFELPIKFLLDLLINPIKINENQTKTYQMKREKFFFGRPIFLSIEKDYSVFAIPLLKIFTFCKQEKKKMRRKFVGIVVIKFFSNASEFADGSLLERIFKQKLISLCCVFFFCKQTWRIPFFTSLKNVFVMHLQNFSKVSLIIPTFIFFFIKKIYFEIFNNNFTSYTNY